jgi:diguanylate cyclase (GGDEF)-like protein/PAS domain S-box-containing protein
MTSRTHGKSIKKTGLPEAAFALSEQDSRNIIECSPDFIVRYDPNGRIRFMNHGLLDLLGVSANEVTGKLPVELWPDGRYAEIDLAAAQALKTGDTAIAEFRAAGIDGELYFKQVYVVPEKDEAGQIIGTIAYGRCISALREAENKLRHFIENIPGMAYTFRLSPDGHGSFPFISSGIEEFFGLKPDEVRHSMMPIQLLTHPDDRPRIEAAIAESARTMQPYYAEYRICRPGYPERWIDARSTPELDTDGGILWHGIMLDITNKKQLEIQQVTYLHHYQSMDRVNRAMQGTNDLEKMMHDVLDVVLSIFDCDRAFIASPPTPDNLNLHIHMERSKPEYPGSIALGLPIVIDNEITEQLRSLKESPEPVQFGQGANYPLSHTMAERYQIKSQMIMTLQPKLGDAWLFGIHLCRHPQLWSRAEERLFQKIGQRMQDGLTSLLMYRNLSSSEQNFRSLAENIPDGIVRYNRKAQVIYANQEVKRYIGNVADTITGTTPREHHPNGSFEDYAQVLDQVLASGKAGEIEKTSIFPNRKKWISHIKIVPERDENGDIVSALAIGHDISEQKRLERQLKSHLYYLEQMDKINRAMQGTNDLEQVLRNVLDVVLAIFDCERTFLFNPDEINSVTPLTSMERIKPGYPGPLTLGKTLPLDDELRSAHRIIMERASPVQFGPDAECPVPRCLHDQYQVKSQILMVLHPKLGKPWLFGIHRCIVPELCSETEAQLFQEIGQRLQDALTGLLMYRDLSASEQKFRSLAENMPDNVVRYNRKRETIYVNPALERLLGMTEAELTGKTPRELNLLNADNEHYSQLIERVIASGNAEEVEMLIPGPNEEMRVHQIRIIPEFGKNGEVSGALGIGRDITQQKHEEEILCLAYHDTLTGLPNRRLLIDRLEHTMSASKRSRRYVALMFIDLDNFKPLNDQYGHDTGDQLLIAAAERIASCIRDADTVARFGGDEFVVLLSDLDTEKTSAVAQAELVAEKIRATLSAPYLLGIPQEDGQENLTVQHLCTSSIGVVVVINHEASVANVLKWADAAMYQAKDTGRNRVHFHQFTS